MMYDDWVRAFSAREAKYPADRSGAEAREARRRQIEVWPTFFSSLAQEIPAKPGYEPIKGALRTCQTVVSVGVEHWFRVEEIDGLWRLRGQLPILEVYPVPMRDTALAATGANTRRDFRPHNAHHAGASGF